jgi:hypothetical protein
MGDDLAKGDNFGGIPKKLLDEIVGVFAGVLAPGITQDDAIGVLVALVREEHDAANPGPGVTGFLDAFTALDELKSATEIVKGASATNMHNAVTILQQKILALNQLWLVGPAAPGFFTPER